MTTTRKPRTTSTRRPRAAAKPSTTATPADVAGKANALIAQVAKRLDVERDRIVSVDPHPDGTVHVAYLDQHGTRVGRVLPAVTE